MYLEETMPSRADKGLAMWLAIEDAAKRWEYSDDVMGVGQAGSAVVVIRVHCVEPEIFAKGQRQNPLRRIG